ncbi:hypothetical protein Tco_0959338 [Tanacetum coccineum]
MVRRDDQKLYKFMKGDFPNLHLNDIEDMMLLHVQNKLFKLEGDINIDLAVALCWNWGRFLLGVSGPTSQLKFYGSFEHHVHKGFHLLIMVLGASGSPPCGCVVNP